MPIFGELPLLPKTYYSVELFARVFVPERNESLRFMVEENVYWDEAAERWKFVRGRQERYHLVEPIPRPPKSGQLAFIEQDLSN